MEIFDELIKQKEKTIIAIVGASNNPDKYGHIVYKNLKEKGFKIFPVNLNEEKILNDTCYPNLTFLPERPDIIVLVVPPKSSLSVIGEVIELGLNNLWFQPGSYDDEVRKKLDEAGLNYSLEACIMVKTSILNSENK